MGVSCLVFLLIHLVPGDPVEVMLGESAQSVDREALRHTLGLDQPIPIQLVRYFNGLVHLNLGTSLHSQRSIVDLLTERFPATVELALAGFLIAIGIAFPLGIFAAVRKDTFWDHLAIGISLLGVSLPVFWMGPVLILILSLWLGLFPVSGREGPASLVLPALTLGIALSAILSRMVRASLLEVLNEDYIRTARAKGLRERTVIWQHALFNSLLPVITVLGLQLGGLLAGTVIVETVFSWPGIGLLMVEAIQKRDYLVVQGCVLLISFTYILVNTLTDLFYAWFDPRIRLREES
jgi:peptide/nickel transport system permease protein